MLSPSLQILANITWLPDFLKELFVILFRLATNAQDKV